MSSPAPTRSHNSHRPDDCDNCQLLRAHVVDRTLALAENMPGQFALVLFVGTDGKVSASARGGRARAAKLLTSVLDTWTREGV